MSDSIWEKFETVDCMDCGYWKRLNVPGAEGECRRYPPTVVVMVTSGDFENLESEDAIRWPETNGEDWCGEGRRNRWPAETRPALSGEAKS
jgi:hypothetical protein